MSGDISCVEMYKDKLRGQVTTLVAVARGKVIEILTVGTSERRHVF